ncbi:DUF1127 domain-containing protein [Roseibium sp.]|uniref:DUF1127 domain-containing protein n=1 Tax=Roseibium sp. TaxID=1936156 RepID=UPI003D109767
MSSIETIGGRPVSRLSFRGPLWRTIFARLGLWMQTARTRRQLLELSPAELKDLGLTSEAARAEACRPFWDTCVYNRSGR